jgi:hypothetical protein
MYVGPSFAAVLWQTFAGEAMFGLTGLYKIVYDSLHFVSPYLLNQLS